MRLTYKEFAKLIANDSGESVQVVENVLGSFRDITLEQIKQENSVFIPLFARFAHRKNRAGEVLGKSYEESLCMTMKMSRKARNELNNKKN